ncbi:MAG: GGDEF domain-containing protein [Treponema sp.]|nr:GGDEF domain-containing protein [Treponema sp.]
MFTIIVVIFTGFGTYVNQMRSYKKQVLENVRNIGDYLERLIQDSGNEFVSYQKYYMEHYAEVDIPYDFTDYHDALEEALYNLAYYDASDFVDSKSLKFDMLPEDVKKTYFIYCHEYWILTFENARKAFNLPYTYYLVPDEETYTMYYMIDGERLYKDDEGNKAESGKYLYLGDHYFNSLEQTPVEWKTWFTGERQNEFQEWNNAWGHTYTYYTPLIINGQKLGLIGTEVQVDEVNQAILKNTGFEILGVTLVLVVCLTLMLHLLNVLYIKKIVLLESSLREYSEYKNIEVAHKIASDIKDEDEISSLSMQFASLIVELDKYMRNLFSTSKELKDAKKRATEMDMLANRDSLTGVRNKNAYDNEIRRLELDLQSGKTDFGIAMIDLNFLKSINDTYGHERGNIAIQRLCSIVCTVFEHSPVFRIGGDEFVVILEKIDYKIIDDLVHTFNMIIDRISVNEELEPWQRVSAAIGYALYDKNLDNGVLSVFTRADQAMYTHKKEMKALREV